jgi:hypothetical protein
MATADVITPGIQSALFGQKPQQHNVQTALNYYKAPEDGSPPAPYYIG